MKNPLWLGLLLLTLWWIPGSAKTDLPQPITPVLDLVGILEPAVVRQLTEQIGALERDQEWKVRILIQKNEIPGRQIKTYWALDERSVLIVLDLKERNPLLFNVGDQVRKLLPRVFWAELQSRYGNQFYINKEGRGQALLASVEAIDRSLRVGGRETVPGLSREHWILTFVSSIVGGLVAGFAIHPRRKGEVWHWQGLMFSMPLWAIFYLIFGLGVVLVRTPEIWPLIQNSGGFLAGALTAFLIPTPKRITTP